MTIYFYKAKKVKNKYYVAIAALLMALQNVNATNANEETILPEIKVVSTKYSENYKIANSRSSTHTDTKLINIPQSISVVTQEQIHDQNITNMEEAVRYVPGVNIQQGESNRDQVTIRGNTSTADFFVDGLRDDAQYFRDFYNIEEVEFLKGPNAMAFGRGGSGGVINRVTKYANGARKRSIAIAGGSFDNRRAQIDVGDKINEKLSLRLNAMYEKSGTFRKYGDLERYGFNPTAALKISKNTDLKFGYEHFRDQRFNDRGIPSHNGEAYKTKASTFYGNPNENYSQAQNDSAFLNLEHNFSQDLQIANKTRYIKNHKFYQNVYANSVVGNSGSFNLAAYNQKTNRESFINQTDLTKKFNIGTVKHVGLLGAEIVRQDTKNLRNTGYFNNLTTSRVINAANPLDFTAITYRQSASDINNNSKVETYALYAQDQIEINKYLQLIGGVRFDRFSIDLNNYRNNQNLKRIDDLISPRFGVVLKPQENLSIYGNYSASYLPSSGDQFGALTDRTKFLKPEKMENREIGFKWDINSALNLSSSIYELNRTNSPANDPNNAGYYLLNGKSRIRGFELSATGKITNQWQMIAGYNFQEGEILSNIATSANTLGSTSQATSGNKLALTPHNKFSLWNKYAFSNAWSAGIGVVTQSSQYAALDNAVKLKGFTRFDGAIYYKVNPHYRLQLNVENIFNNRYNISAHNNNNIQPGSVRAFKINLVAEF